MFRVLACVCVVMGLFVGRSFAVTGGELPPAEKTKIEKLIEHVKGLKDAAFVRNDVEYDAATAAQFLQAKWQANATEIKSAAEFIEKAASKSSTTGKPYLIRLKHDGATREFKTGEYLLEQLKKLELPQ